MKGKVMAQILVVDDQEDIVQFVVKEDGTLSNFIVLKSVSKSFDNNFIRMLKKMPKWKPGKKNNINVKTIYILNYFVGK